MRQTSDKFNTKSWVGYAEQTTLFSKHPNKSNKTNCEKRREKKKEIRNFIKIKNNIEKFPFKFSL